MKRILSRVAVCLALATASLSLTSCDENTLNIIGGLLGEVLGGMGNQSETYNYTGTITSESLVGSQVNKKWTYVNSNKQNTVPSAQVSLQYSNTGTITIPAYTDGDVKVNGLTIANLAASTEDNITSFELSDASQMSGTITYKGKTYNLYSLYIDDARATQGEMVLEITFYFVNETGDDCCNAINFSFEGVVK